MINHERARALGYHRPADVLRAARRALRWLAANGPHARPPRHIAEKLLLLRSPKL